MYSGPLMIVDVSSVDFRWFLLLNTRITLKNHSEPKLRVSLGFLFGYAL